MKPTIILTAAAVTFLIAFAAPAEARRQSATQDAPITCGQHGCSDYARYIEPPTEAFAGRDRSERPRARSRAVSHRAKVSRTARHSPEGRKAPPLASYAVLPIGDVVPAPEPVRALPVDPSDEITAYADGLAYTAPQSDIDVARAYLVKTAHVGGVMARMGRELYLAKLRGYVGTFNIFGVFKTALETGNIEQIGVEQNVAALNPKFVLMAAQAIKTARAHGVEVGLFSGYRPAGYGVGGFASKFDSCHTYAVAGDFWGVEKNYAVWTKAAREAGLSRPYASSWERNHWQAVPDKTCRKLRSTVTASGPKNLERMWKAAYRMIDRAHGQTRFAEGYGRTMHAKQYHRGRYRVAHR